MVRNSVPPGKSQIRTAPSVTQLEARITNQVPAPTEPKYVFDPELRVGAVRQTDTARGGFDVRIGRVVRHGDQVLAQDTFFSRYQAWPNIFVRGPVPPPQPTPDPAVVDPNQAPPTSDGSGLAGVLAQLDPTPSASEPPVESAPTAQPQG